MVWWWRGNGLWVALMTASVIYGASQAFGEIGTALGSAASAVLIFLFKDEIGKESSLYSFPVRFWPPLLLGLSLLIMADHTGRGEQPHSTTKSQPSTAKPQTTTVASPAPAVQPIHQSSGLPAFEFWADKHLAASAFRYQSADEVWISMSAIPSDPQMAANNGAVQYKQFMSRSTPVKVVLFANNVRVAEATE